MLLRLVSYLVLFRRLGFLSSLAVGFRAQWVIFLGSRRSLFSFLYTNPVVDVSNLLSWFQLAFSDGR